LAARRRERRDRICRYAAPRYEFVSRSLRRLNFVSNFVTPSPSALTRREPSLGGKWLELLSEIAPGLKRAAIMFNPDTTAASVYMPSFEAAARSLKIVPINAPAHSDAEIEMAINDLGREPRGGLVVMPDIFTRAHRVPILLAATRNNVPAIYRYSYFVRDGGLLSYGPDAVDIFRRAATYVDRILRGEKPDDLPVQFPTKFEMAVNLKTAGTSAKTTRPLAPPATCSRPFCPYPQETRYVGARTATLQMRPERS
jgi:putative ABC transport system substrate-binding protein